MRYVPAVDLWGPAMERLLSGELRLQPGQWVYCGSARPSRFVCVKPCGTVWAVHPQGGTVSNRRFKQLLSLRPK